LFSTIINGLPSGSIPGCEPGIFLTIMSCNANGSVVDITPKNGLKLPVAPNGALTISGLALLGITKRGSPKASADSGGKAAGFTSKLPNGS